MLTAEQIATSLNKCRKQGGGFLACCPAHKDNNPSLNIRESKDGRVLLKCFSGCSQEEVIQSLRSMGLWRAESPLDLRHKEDAKAIVDGKIFASMLKNDQDTGRNYAYTDDELTCAKAHVELGTELELDRKNQLAQMKVTSLPEFPVMALGPKLGNAAKALSEQIQVPLPIACHSVLAVAAFLAQQRHDVSIPGYRRRPLSLFLLTIGESGDRKSAVDGLATSPLLEWHRNAQIEFNRKQEMYLRDLEDYEELLHSKSKDKMVPPKPEPPASVKFMLEEPTLEALYKCLHTGRPSQILANDEGGQFFGGHAMNKDSRLKTIAGLSRLWDGTPITRDRAGKNESIPALYGRRLSSHLMVQPIITAEILADPVMREQGIMARFLVAESQSLAGTRLFRRTDKRQQSSAINNYIDRVNELMDMPLSLEEDGGLKLEALEMDPSAINLWIDFYNSVERESGPGGKYEAVKPTASKMAEQVARIAGVVTTFEAAEIIDKETMKGATALGYMYLDQACRIAQKAEVDQSTRIQSDILDWIGSQGGSVSMVTIQSRSPRGLKLRAMSAQNIRRHLAKVCQKGLLTVTENNSRGQPSTWSLTGS